MRPNENDSPLFSNLQRVAQFLESKPELAKCSTAIQDIVMNAWRADHFYRPPPQNVSIFKSVLARIDAMLTPVRAEWLGGMSASYHSHFLIFTHTYTSMYSIYVYISIYACDHLRSFHWDDWLTN